MDGLGISLETLRPKLMDCLSGGLPGSAAQQRFAPELAYGRHAGPPAVDAREAAVLVLAYPHHGEWYVPTIVRAHSMKEHAGQIALPGGAVDAGEAAVQTALREFEEELGASRADIDVLGALSPIYVFNSNYYVRPFLALCLVRPHFQPNAGEVAELIEVPLRALSAPENQSSHQIHRRGVTFQTPHFQIGPHRIWGATAMILAEVLAILGKCAALGGT